MNLQDFDAAIIDLDGTMVDTLGDFSVALNRMLADLQLGSIQPADIAHRVGKGSEHLIATVLSHVRGGEPADEALRNQAFERYQHHYLAINGQHAEVFPGVIAGLADLAARGLRLACLTNKPGNFTRPLLAAKQLDRFFAVVNGGDAFDRKKPDPLPLLKTCEQLGTTPARTLMVGDSSNDARAARAAGCKVVLVSYGYNHGEPVSGVDCDGIVDSIADIGARFGGPVQG